MAKRTANATCYCEWSTCDDPSAQCSEPTPGYFSWFAGGSGSCTDTDTCYNPGGGFWSGQCSACTFGYFDGDYLPGGGSGTQCVSSCSGVSPPIDPPSGCDETDPAAPTLVSPANGGNVPSGTVALDWNAVSNWGENCDGDGPPNSDKKYRVYFGLQGSKALIATVTDPTTVKNVSVLTGNTYEWQIGAYNADSDIEAKSPTRTFSVGSAPTGSITAPVAGSTYHKYTTPVGGSYNNLNVKASAADSNDGISLMQVYYATQSAYNANPNDPSIWTLLTTKDCAGATTCTLGTSNSGYNWADPPVGYKVLTLNVKNTKNEWCSTNQPVGVTVGFAACGQLPLNTLINAPPSASITIEPTWPQNPTNDAYQFDIDDGKITFEATATDGQFELSSVYRRKLLSPPGGPWTKIGITSYTAGNYLAEWTPTPSDIGFWEIHINSSDTLGGFCSGNFAVAPSTQAPCAQPRSNPPPADPYSDNDMFLVEIKENVDVPWFSNSNSDIFIASGISLVSPATPIAPFSPPTFVYGQTPKSAPFSNGSITFGGGTLSQSGDYAYGTSVGANWPAPYKGEPPSSAIDLKGATGEECGAAFNRNDFQAAKFTVSYYTDLDCAQQAINSASADSYQIGGPSIGFGETVLGGVVVVYVSGSGDLEFNSKFVPADSDERLLLVLGPDINVVYGAGVGATTLASTSPTPDIDVGIISLKGITFEGNGLNTDKSVVVKGPIMTKSNLTLQRDRGANNAYPAEMFEYYPNYLYQITERTRQSTTPNFTGLTVVDLQYE